MGLLVYEPENVLHLLGLGLGLGLKSKVPMGTITGKDGTDK